jgi:hypothetical protein
MAKQSFDIRRSTAVWAFDVICPFDETVPAFFVKQMVAYESIRHLSSDEVLDAYAAGGICSIESVDCDCWCFITSCIRKSGRWSFPLSFTLTFSAFFCCQNVPLLRVVDVRDLGKEMAALRTVSKKRQV